MADTLLHGANTAAQNHMPRPPAPVEAEEGGFLSRWSRRKALVRQADALADTAPQPAGAPQAETPALHAALLAAPVPRLEAAIDGGAASATATANATATATASANATAAKPDPANQAAPLPTMADVAALTRDSDFSRFVARTVQPDVKNAALSKLFTDPHFNVMDGLDTYIDDYGKPDPLPEGMLRKLLQSHVLGLFDHEKENEGLTPEMALQAHTDALAAAQHMGDAPATPGAGEPTATAEIAPQIGSEAAPIAAPSFDVAAGPVRHNVTEPVADTVTDTVTQAAPHENTALQLQPHDGAGRPSAAASAVQDAGRRR